MRTSDFDYDLPPSLIAQDPLPDRGGSRLLVLDRAAGAVRHGRFVDVVDLVAPEDVLVINVSRVIPARLHGKRETGNVAELLLVRELPDGTWLAMGHPGGKLKPGRRVTFGPDSSAEIVEALGGGLRRVRFVGPLDAPATLAQYGEVPLPPYIRRAPRPEDRERYQTVYAAHETDDLARHAMHAEPYRVSDAAAALINQRRDAGGRVWAVGTTVVRTLETLAGPGGRISPGAGETRLFIHPPYAFRAVDRLLTNFHLPRSTLLMLVCAFGGYDNVMRAYGEAIEQRYRFYSYGDAMLVV